MKFLLLSIILSLDEPAKSIIINLTDYQKGGTNMALVPFSNVMINGGFWKEKQDLIKNTTVHAVYDRFKETHRFDALKCQWKDGDPNMPHIFWDSDVAKWIEGVAYLLSYQRDAALEALVDEAVEDIVRNSDEHGYFNSHYLVTEQDQRFQNRDCHELYCAGHLIEAAVAYYNATGKDAFLKAMCRYADYIEQIFKIEKSAAFITPGHPELELALVKLYHCTGEKRYLELSKHFIDEHGTHDCERIVYPNSSSCYNQDEIPLRQRETADGHCVRAQYLLCGMADIADIYQDDALLDACRRVFSNIVNKRMYITGSTGSTHMGESFTVDYHLPNRRAYAETCAAISLAMFAGRMQAIEPKAIYADTFERAIYNGILSGLSMDGKSFFYENPLEIDPKFNDVHKANALKEHFAITQRVAVFDCSCCPPNVVRFIPSLSGWMYSTKEDTVFVHHYASSSARFGKSQIEQTTNYPADGTVTICCSGIAKLALRIPGWCRCFTLNHPYTLLDGYAYLELDGDTQINLELDMPVTVIAANRQVHETAGRVAVTRGPVVYCIEGVDNGADLKAVSIDPMGSFVLGDQEFMLPSLLTTGYRPLDSDALYAPVNGDFEQIPLRFIPYYAFANRGTTEMQVWLLRK